MKEKILKAEMWDKMQYLFRNYYDRMIHGVLCYDGLIDIDALKTVLICITEQVPVLHSSFVGNIIRPYWEIKDYTIDDIFSVIDTNEPEKETEAFITGTISVDNNVQYKVKVINSQGRSRFCIIVNHMCFDGGELKYFLKKLCYNYNRYTLEKISPLDIKTGSREFEQVYSKLSEREERVARKLYKNISSVKDKHCFPLSAPSDEDKTMIIRHKIDCDTFSALRLVGKKYGATVNDEMLALYIQSLYEIGRFPESESLTIPCMVDLRRHIIDGGEKGGLSNHTGFMQCHVPYKGKTILDTLLLVMKSVAKSKHDKYMGLYSLPLLKLAYAIFPHVISEQAIKIGYTNPLIGMSNIGAINVDELKLADKKVTDGFLTGAVKYKPYMQLALTSLNGEITLSVAIRGNDKDRQIVEEFYSYIDKNVSELIATAK